MENIPILRDFVILIAVCVPISIIFARIGIPTIVGFLVTGVLIGPFGLGLVTEMHSVEVLAEIGVVLLLFTIGLEFSLTKMLKIRREALYGGGLQVAITVLLVLFFVKITGFSLQVAILMGFIVSLSSTAITMKLLLDRSELNSSHGNFSVGILLFQDLAVVFMVIVLHSLGESGGVEPLAIAEGLGIAIVAIIIIVLFASKLLPKLFQLVLRLRNREVFILTIVLVCMGTAIITSLFGLSLALGSFIAGLVISDSEYSEQIVSDVIPFRDTFSSVFFISIGMLLEFKFFIYNLPQLILISIAILIVKALIITVIGRLLRYPIRLSIQVGLILAQVGEFSFILIKMGKGYEILSEPLYQTMLAVSIITMALAPFIFKYSGNIAYTLGGFLGARELKRDSARKPKAKMSNHVLIVGYGITGQNLSKVLLKTGINHIVIDMNADRVKEAVKEKHMAFYGDASHHDFLRKMGVERAKVIVVAITDPIGTRRIVKNARDLSASATIVVRTRYIREVEDLYKLGASQVIPEEFETSVEIFARVLKDYAIPTNIIENQIDLVREQGYAMLRHPDLSSSTMQKLTAVLEATIMDTFYVDDTCNIAGKTIGELNLRNETGVNIIAVVRSGKAETNPRADYRLESADILVLLGAHAELHQAMEILRFKCPG